MWRVGKDLERSRNIDNWRYDTDIRLQKQENLNRYDRYLNRDLNPVRLESSLERCRYLNLLGKMPAD
jgi:hypothetical protein